MADDPIPLAQTALVKARNILDPEIEGMIDRLALPSTSSELRAVVTEEKAVKDRRHGLIQTALNALAALVQDGWPDDPTVPIQKSLLAEMQEQNARLLAATNVFTQETTVDFNANAPVTDVTQPVPNQTP